jgi:hypothetical protein
MLPRRGRERRPDDWVHGAVSDRVVGLVSRMDLMTSMGIVKGDGQLSGAEPD